MRGNKKSVIHIPLTRGLDQSTDENLAEAGNLFSVVNMRVYGDGLLEPRTGGTGISPTSLNQSATGGVPLLVATNSAFQVSAAGGDKTKKPSVLSTVGDAPIIGDSDGNVFAINGAYAAQYGQFSRATPKRERSSLRMTRYPSNPTLTAPSSAVNSDGYLMVVIADDLGNGASGLSGYVESPTGVRTATIAIDVGPVFKTAVVSVGAKFYLYYETIQAGVNTVLIVECTIDSGGGLSRTTPLSWTDVTTRSWDVTADDKAHYLVYTSSTGAVVLFGILPVSGFTSDSETVLSSTNGTAPCSVSVGPNNEVWVGIRNKSSGGLPIVQYRVYNFDPDIPLLTTESALITIEGYDATTKFAGPPLIGPWKNEQFTALAVWNYRERDSTVGAGEYAGMKVAKIGVNGVISQSQIYWHVVPIAKPDPAMRVWCITSEINGGANPYSGGGSPSSTARVACVSFWPASFVSDQISFAGVELSGPAMPNPDGYRLNVGILTWEYDFFTQVAFKRETGGNPADGTTFFFAYPLVLARYLEDTYKLEIRVYEYETADNLPHRQAQKVGDGTLIVGGVPVQLPWFSQPQRHTSLTALDKIYNNPAGACEVGFLTRPHIENAVHVAGTGLNAGQQYSYRALYEGVDDLGQRHRSAPSEPQLFTPSAANDSPHLAVDLLSASKRQVFPTGFSDSLGNPQILVYRTVGAGTQYYRLPTAFPSSPTLSNPSALGRGYMGFIDTFSDAQIATQENLYTDGGVKNNNLAPTSLWSTTSEDRVWLGGGWDRAVIQCSKIIVPQEPVQFTDSDAFKVALPFQNTAIAYMDGHVFAFGLNDIAVITGDGPNDQGIGSFNMRIFARGVGCQNHRSVLETKGGIFFQGPDGWYRIPRGPGEPEYIGAVRDEFEGNSAVVHSAAVVPGKAGAFEAHWLTGPSGSSASEFSIVTDGKRWFKDYYGTVTMLELGAWPKGKALARSSFANADLGTERAIIYDDEADQMIDDQIGYAPVFTTSRIWPFGPNGWGRAQRVVLSFLTDLATTITMRIWTDDKTVQSKNFSVGGTGVVQFRELLVQHPECSSFKIEVTEGPITRPAVKHVALSVDVDDSGGLVRLPQGSRS